MRLAYVNGVAEEMLEMTSEARELQKTANCDRGRSAAYRKK